MNTENHPFITIIICILFLFGLFKLIGSFTTPSYNSNDKECDICGKRIYKKINGEEYCETHYVDAIEYYYDVNI